jgi:hypothetical protein
VRDENEESSASVAWNAQKFGKRFPILFKKMGMFSKQKYQNFKKVGSIEKINYHEVEERVTEAKT